MRIVFMGGNQAGVIGLLTCLAKGHEVVQVIARKNNMVETLALEVGHPVVYNHAKYAFTKDVDLFVCVHGRDIVPKEYLEQVPCINVHPCLSKYKGARPIKRLLEEPTRTGWRAASVGVHYMTEFVDKGPVICEVSVSVMGESEGAVYNELYPYYAIALSRALEEIDKKVV